MADANKKLVDEMMSHMTADFINYEPSSEVAKFYANRSVFITGSTGFIGKVIIEKLLRSCKDIKKIYLLIRGRRNKDPQERLTKLIQSTIFQPIRSRPGGCNIFDDKLRVVSGDITLPKFGIVQTDMEELSREVSIVFNSAATVSFVETIDESIKYNVNSVTQLVEFCDQLENLKAIIHFSTAYSNSHKRDTIHEIFYEPPMNGDKIINAVDKLKKIQDQIHVYPIIDDGEEQQDGQPSRNACKQQNFYDKNEIKANINLLDSFARIITRIANRPNTYTLTKAIAESHLLEKLKQRPERYLNDKIQLAIVRPSTVCSTWREPFVGFVDNFNGMTGSIVSLHTGLLQAGPGKKESIADIVPVDMVTNMTICLGWFLVNGHKDVSVTNNAKKIISDNGVYIFNYVSGNRNPMGILTFFEAIHYCAYKYPSKYLFRLASSFIMYPLWLYELYDLLNHKFIFKLHDFVRGTLMRLELKGNSSGRLLYRRNRLIWKILLPFTTSTWLFDNKNVCSLYERLTDVDKQVFHFDVSVVDWYKFMRNYVVGSRIYALRDEPQSLPRALKTLVMLESAILDLFNRFVFSS